jgi:GntR family transcriptional regulator
MTTTQTPERQKPETERRAPIPAYRRIYEELRARIERGLLKPGDRIESERELAARCGVSLMTARHAVNELEAEGLVSRRVGAGTYVTPPRIRFNRLESFTEQMAARGLAARSKIVGLHVTESEHEVATRLALPPGSRLLRIERVRCGGKEPFAFETTFVPFDRFPKVATLVRSGGSLFDALRRAYDVVPGWADEEVDATSVDGRLAELLGVPRHSPVLRIRELVFSSSGDRLLYDVGIYRSDRHSLVIRRFR